MIGEGLAKLGIDRAHPADVAHVGRQRGRVRRADQRRQRRRRRRPKRGIDVENPEARIALQVAYMRDLKLFGFLEMLLFIAIVLAGYIYVWKKGALEWER